MFKLIDSVPYVNQLFFDTAKVKTASDKTILQKGGFVYLDTSSGPGLQKYCTVPKAADVTAANTAIANATGGIGGNILKTKLIYPVFISRPQDSNFNPIGDNDMITFINSSGYEGWLTSDSYHQNADASYPDFAAGLPLVYNYVTNGTEIRPRLTVLPAASASTSNLHLVIVAYALSAVVNSEVKIKWVA